MSDRPKELETILDADPADLSSTEADVLVSVLEEHYFSSDGLLGRWLSRNKSLSADTKSRIFSHLAEIEHHYGNLGTEIRVLHAAVGTDAIENCENVAAALRAAGTTNKSNAESALSALDTYLSRIGETNSDNGPVDQEYIPPVKAVAAIGRDVPEVAHQAIDTLSTALDDDTSNVAATVSSSSAAAEERIREIVRLPGSSVNKVVSHLLDQIDNTTSSERNRETALAIIAENEPSAFIETINDCRREHLSPTRSHSSYLINYGKPSRLAVLECLHRCSDADLTEQEQIRSTLTVALGDSSSTVRATAVDQIAEIDWSLDLAETDTIKHLVAMIDDEDPVQDAVVSALYRLHWESQAAVLDAFESRFHELTSPSTEFVDGLARLAEPDPSLCSRVFYAALKSDTRTVRRTALEALEALCTQIPPIGAAILAHEIGDGQTHRRKDIPSALPRVSSAKTTRSELVSALEEALNDAESEVRRDAAVALARVAEISLASMADTVDIIVETILRDPEPTVRAATAEVLSRYTRRYPDGLADQLLPLVNGLRDDDPTVRSEVAATLGQVDIDDPDNAQEIVTKIAVILKDPVERVRVAAAEAIENIHSEYPEATTEITETLVRAVADDAVGVRCSAVSVLATDVEESAEDSQWVLDGLVSALADDTDSVRRSASEAIATVAADNPVSVVFAVDELVSRLDDPDSDVQNHARAAIRRLGDHDPTTVLEPLAAVVEDGTGEHRRIAVTGLPLFVPEAPDELEDPIGLLVEALNEEPEIRGTVARAMGRIGEEYPELVTDDIGRLATIAATADSDDRKSAISSLGRIGTTDPSVVADTLDPLVNAASAQDSSVRREATEALGQIGAASPSLMTDKISVVAERLQDGEEPVRTSAAEACAEIASVSPHQLTDCIEPLGVLAADGTETQQGYAVEALSAIAAEAPAATAVVTDQLVTALQTDDGDISSAAAAALADISTSDVPVPSATVDELTAALSQPGVVGVNAASVLCEITEATPAATVDHLDTIVDRFDDGDHSVRRSITEILRSHSRQFPSMVEPHIQTLAMALDDEDRLLRKDAAHAIGNLAGADLSERANIVELLADRLADFDDTATRIAVAYAILAITCEEGEVDGVTEEATGTETTTGQRDDRVDEALVEDAMSTLLDIIVGDSQSDTVAAISALGRLNAVPSAYTEPITDAVRPYVTDESDPEARAAAIRALGSVATVAPKRIRPLEETLQTALVAQEAMVRAASVETLGHLTATSPERAQDRTARIEMALEDQTAAVQEAAARALGRVGREHPDQIQAAIDPVLDRLLDDRQTVRRGALSAVEHLSTGSPNLVFGRNRIQPLIEAVATDPIEAPPEAIDALAIAAEHDVEIGGDAVAGIVELIDTSAVPPQHRQQALSIIQSVAETDQASVSTINSDELMSALEGLLTADSAELRRAAVLTLPKCCSSRDETARDLLRGRLHDDPDPGVRGAANDALVTLRTTTDTTPGDDQESRSTPASASVDPTPVAGDDGSEQCSTDRVLPEQHETIPDDVLKVDPSSVSWEHLNRERQLGTGGYAAVVRATAPDRDQPIALKLPRGYAESSNATEHNLSIEILTTEGNRWRHLQESGTHPNIVTLLDTGRDQGVPWLALEYMDGGTLADRQDDITTEEALWITARIADALQYAHRYMGTHQDVKPTNILFRQTPDGTPDWPKLGDWGVATFGIEDRQSVDAFSESYAAPEQLIADDYGRPSQLTDVYQLGAVCYELVTGTTPDSVHKRPTPPSESVDIQQPVDEILRTALAPSPDDRYGSMAQFKTALDHLL